MTRYLMALYATRRLPHGHEHAGKNVVFLAASIVLAESLEDAQKYGEEHVRERAPETDGWYGHIALVGPEEDNESTERFPDVGPVLA